MSSMEIDAEEQPRLGVKYRRGWRGLFLKHRQNHPNLILYPFHLPVEGPREKSSPILTH